MIPDEIEGFTGLRPFTPVNMKTGVNGKIYLLFNRESIISMLISPASFYFHIIYTAGFS